MNNKRANRISEEIKKVISQLLVNGIKDPRINTMTSVTNVEVTNDLRYVNIYISVLGDDKSKTETLEGLRSAKGFIRSTIGKELGLRYAPEPIFKIDESIEISINMSKLIDEVSEMDKLKREEDED